MVDAASYSDSYILKLTSTGNFIWGVHFPGVSAAGASNGFSVSVDNAGNIYSVRTFAFGVDFDPGASVYTLTSIGSNDTYISKLDPSGNFIYAYQLGGGNFTSGIPLYLDLQRNLYIGGHYMGTSDFDPTPAVFNMTSVGSSDAFVLKLSQCVQSLFSISDTACYSYTLNNQTYNSSGIYTQILVNSFGCDSVITLNLTIGGSVTNLTVSSCNSYTWQEQTYTSSGIYSVLFIDRFGCDSILNLNLTVNNNILTTINATICEGQVYAGHTTSGTYIDTYPASNGCDSIRTLQLVVNPKSYSTINYTICEGQSYLGYGVAGTYVDTYMASNGCDSIRTLILQINPRTYSSNNVSICEGEFFYVANANQTLTGIYRDTLTGSLGCDSVITTYLTVNPKPLPNLGQDKSICSNTYSELNPGSFISYLWQDMSNNSVLPINAAGQYWVTVKNTFNCIASDTITILGVNNSPENFLKSTDSICQRKNLVITPVNNFTAYIWSTGSTQNSITIQNPGNYWLKVADSNGCFGYDTISVFQKNCFSEVYFPNAFTPNGDSKNDVFKPSVYGNLVSFKLQIYNRYGELVFQTSDSLKGWDGKFKGVVYSTSVFTWQCTYQLVGKMLLHEKGTVTLIR